MYINIDHDAPSALIQYEDRWNASILNASYRNQVIYCQLSSFVWIAALDEAAATAMGNGKGDEHSECTVHAKIDRFHDMSKAHAHKLCERAATSRQIYYSIILQVVCALFGLFVRWCTVMSISYTFTHPITHHRLISALWKMHFSFAAAAARHWSISLSK